MPRWALAFLLMSACAWATPLPENPAGRRAVRGSPVEVTHESDELRQLREFDEESFPRAPAGTPPAESAASTVRQISSTHTGPDAIPAPLRSPDHELVKPIETPPAIPWLSELKAPDLPVRFDPRVVRYLEFYKSDKRGRAIMTSWLKKEGRWKALFEEALRRAKLPLSLTYVSMIESGFDPDD